MATIKEGELIRVIMANLITPITPAIKTEKAGAL